MSDEQTPQEPTPVEPTPPEVTPPTEVKKVETKLELLPDYIKTEMHALIAQGYGCTKIKNAIEDRYLNKTKFLPAGTDTYQDYINAHKEEILKGFELQKALIDSTKDSLSDVKTAIDTTVAVDSIENKKNALLSLYTKCENRIKLIEIKQNQGLFDPQFESVLGAYLREQRTILEKLITLSEELKKDSTEQLYREVENLVYQWLVACLGAYKKVHGEEKFLEFKSIVQDDIQNILKGSPLETTNPK